MTHDSRAQHGISQSNGIETIMSGRSGAGASLARAGLGVLEIGYRLAIWSRNGLYDAGVLRSHTLGRATISIGNLTTGGTGKTPLVAMLAVELSHRGHHPAVLMRGYHKTRGGQSDEAMLLESAGILVETSPNRRASAARVLARDPLVDVFLLDDGLQHRRVRRDMEVVVIDATEPFGFGHLLPRGMLREPPAALSRAHAIVLTRTGRISGDARNQLINRVKAHSPHSPVYCCDHVIERITASGVSRPASDLSHKPYVVACGIGNPAGFVAAMQTAAAGAPAAMRFFPDHHDYTDADVTALTELAASCKAAAIVVTAKDWVKLGTLPSIMQTAGRVEFCVAELDLRFSGGDRDALIDQTLAAIRPAGASAGLSDGAT